MRERTDMLANRSAWAVGLRRLEIFLRTPGAYLTFCESFRL